MSMGQRIESWQGFAAGRPPKSGLNRRERRHAETRHRLMLAALRLFSERGMAETSVEDITEAADVGKGTFFNYFPSKEHLLVAFGQYQVSKVEATLAEARKGGKPIHQMLRDLARSVSHEPGRTPLLIRSIMVAPLTNDAVRASMIANMARGRKALAEFMVIGQQRGEIRKDVSPRHLARAIQQGMFGAFFLWSLDPSLEISGWLDTWGEIVLAGIEANAQKRGLRRARRSARR
ncbi:MAG TPA: TetR family transcriptional regulator [Methylomirabilota bacterium]|nr:TetR family transcriptional regulator [Methylomirabilota bacterium]